MITIHTPGPQTLIQDLGRRGLRHLGVSWSGAFDASAAAHANALVNNDPSAAVLEVLIGGLAFTTDSRLAIAVTGAPAAATTQLGNNQTAVPFRQQFVLPEGSTFKLGIPTHGMRTYIAFEGGIDAPLTLGSRSWDTLGKIGPRPLVEGQELQVPAEHTELAPQAQASNQPHQSNQSDPDSSASSAAPPIKVRGTDLASSDLADALAASRSRHQEANPAFSSDCPTLTAKVSPHGELIAGDLAELLTSRIWTVGSRSSRIGIRLAGEPLPIEYPKSWRSEPTLPGSIQVAPDGELIVFGPDSPTTGGYPVIAVAKSDALDILSQLRPGSQLKVRITT